MHSKNSSSDKNSSQDVVCQMNPIGGVAFECRPEEAGLSFHSLLKEDFELEKDVSFLDTTKIVGAKFHRIPFIPKIPVQTKILVRQIKIPEIYSTK